MHIVVLGGGITGQMVQWFHPDALILERNPEQRSDRLTREFGANYLWQPIPEMKCKAIRVVTHVDGEPGTDESIQRYKHKIGKPSDIGQWGLQFKPVTVGYVATRYPLCTVQHDCEVVRVDLERKEVHFQNNHMAGLCRYDLLINTLPLPLFCRMAQLDGSVPIESMFKNQPIYVRIVPRPPDATQPPEVLYVNYLSDPLIECYRFCDRDSERHYEGLTPMGTLPSKKLFPGKIWGSPDVQQLLKSLTAKQVVCLGRYGRWAPDELLHETYGAIKDVFPQSS